MRLRGIATGSTGVTCQPPLWSDGVPENNGHLCFLNKWQIKKKRKTAATATMQIRWVYGCREGRSSMKDCHFPILIPRWPSSDYSFPLPIIPPLVAVWRSRNGVGRRINDCPPIPVSTGMGDRLWEGISLRYVTSHLSQLSLLPSAGREISTGQSAVMLCSWGATQDGSSHSWMNVWVGR